jgi:hypothetical protein
MSADQDLNAFIRSTFRSVWSLELMLFLLRNRGRSWSRAELVSAIRGSEAVVGQSLDTLLVAGLIDVDEPARPFPAGRARSGAAGAATSELYARSPGCGARMIVLSAQCRTCRLCRRIPVRKD